MQLLALHWPDAVEWMSLSICDYEWDHREHEDSEIASDVLDSLASTFVLVPVN